MSKHTPGPWSIRKILNRHWEILTSGGYWIGRARGEENARLIAAAPDLLEALDELMDECDIISDNASASYSKALKAYNKATGQ